MSKFARLAVLAAALASLFAIGTSTAGAVTWHNTGAESFHATGGPLTLSLGSNNFACSGSTMTGTSPTGSFSTTNYTMTATMDYSPCNFAGQSLYLHCGTATFTGVAWSAGLTAGNVSLTCDLRLTASNIALCHVSGPTSASYTNPVGATPGRITFLSGAVALTDGDTSCFLGTGAASWSEQSVTLTSGGPFLTRTA